ncbi:MAG: 16S rRNA (cytosine(1402)-N(4))-methyltransferase RsmH, partial [bacterium]
AGGHAAAVLEQLDQRGLLVGFERDPAVFKSIPAHLKKDSRVELINCSYWFMKRELERLGIEEVDVIYFDLGICSYHLEHSKRGFSFQNREEPFDCRFNAESDTPPAWKLINDSSPAQIKKILRQYGEVRQPAAIVYAIEERKPVKKVSDICEAVEKAVIPPRQKGELARVFQAFRIAVNRELVELESSLETALDLLAEGGRLAVISFHSLEDRIVKHFFREQARDCICPPQLPVCACDKKARCRVVNRSPIIPGKEEIEANPRARSAKLRVAEKI